MNEKLNSYWNRPGGKFGTIVGLGLLGLIGWYVLPILTTIAWNTVNFTIGAFALILVLYALSHRNLRLGLFYMYEIAMKKLLGLVMQLDPFIIAESNIKDMIEDREKMGESVQEISSKRQTMDMKIDQKEREVLKAANYAEEAGRKGGPNVKEIVATEARKVARGREFLNNIIPMRDDVRKAEDYMQQLYDKSEFYIEDAKSELESKRELYELTVIGRSALASAVSLFKGDPEKRLLVEQSMQKLMQNTGENLAHMKRSMRVTSGFLEKLDIERGVYETQGLEILKEISSSGFSRASVHGPASAEPSAMGRLLND